MVSARVIILEGWMHLRPASGPVVQSVSTPACHAGGRRFESVPGRQSRKLFSLRLSFFQRRRSLYQYTGLSRPMTRCTPNRGQNTRKSLPNPGRLSACQKSLAEFAARKRRKNQNIFCRGVYLAENTSQAASVEFVRPKRTNYARSRLQIFVEKPTKGFSTV